MKLAAAHMDQAMVRMLTSWRLLGTEIVQYNGRAMGKVARAGGDQLLAQPTDER